MRVRLCGVRMLNAVRWLRTSLNFARMPAGILGVLDPELRIG